MSPYRRPATLLHSYTIPERGPLHIYVAGSSKEIERAEAMVSALRVAGHHITLDWAAEMRKAGAADKDLPIERVREAARADLAAVDTADLVVLLTPAVDKPSAGAWSELTWAYAHQIPVWVVRARGIPQFCIFTSLAEELGGAMFDTDEEVLRRLT